LHWRIDAPVVIRKPPFVTGAAVAILLLHVPVATRAGQHHVTVDGTGQGDGSPHRPWSLDYVFGHPKTIRPGDTVLVHEGTYRGQYISLLRGTEDRPIIVRGYPGKRVTLAVPAGTGGLPLIVAGDYTWYWGLELTDLNTHVDGYNAGAVYIGGRPPTMARGNRLVNCVMHDATGNGISDQGDAEGTEIYGCVVFYNGRLTGDRKYAYGIYGQNRGRRKRYSNNVIFSNYGEYGMHLYSRSDRADSISVTNNILFGGPGASSPILVSSPSPPEGIAVMGNFFYSPEASLPHFIEHTPLRAPAIANNTFAGGQIIFNTSTTDRVFVQNVVMTEPPLRRWLNLFKITFDTLDLPGNVWVPTQGQTDPVAVIRRNAYEPERVLLVVLNPARLDTVALDPGPALVQGQRFILLDVQNLYGKPVLEGSYDGGTISVPMGLNEVTVPISVPPGRQPFRHSGKEFGVFFIATRAL
jgi:hypothetical protein